MPDRAAIYSNPPGRVGAILSVLLLRKAPKRFAYQDGGSHAASTPGPKSLARAPRCTIAVLFLIQLLGRLGPWNERAKLGDESGELTKSGAVFRGYCTEFNFW